MAGPAFFNQNLIKAILLKKAKLFGLGYNQDTMIEVKLPFKKVTARAILIRREDGCLFGVLHQANGQFSPPGGALKQGESPEEALIRELEEEKIRLISPDTQWRERMAVDYFSGRKELNIWYIFLVDDVQLGESKEILDARWLDQTQDVWYPTMREKIFLAIAEHLPDFLKVEVSVLESW